MEQEEKFVLPHFLKSASTLSISSVQQEQTAKPALSPILFNKALV